MFLKTRPRACISVLHGSLSFNGFAMNQDLFELLIHNQGLIIQMLSNVSFVKRKDADAMWKYGKMLKEFKLDEMMVEKVDESDIDQTSR